MTREDDLNECLELMHFGFRKLVEAPDRELARRGFSRLHHRILYFIARNPDLTVGGLLEILGITKQSLHAPLGELVRDGLVARRAAGRVRKLSLTARGTALERRISGIQRAHFARLFRAAGKSAEDGWRTVMRLLAARPIPARPSGFNPTD